MLAYTWTAVVKIARLDGADIKDIRVSDTVRAADKDDVEFVCHSFILDKTIPLGFPGYRVLRLPTETNGRLTVSVVSDCGFKS